MEAWNKWENRGFFSDRHSADDTGHRGRIRRGDGKTALPSSIRRDAGPDDQLLGKTPPFIVLEASDCAEGENGFLVCESEFTRWATSQKTTSTMSF